MYYGSEEKLIDSKDLPESEKIPFIVRVFENFPYPKVIKPEEGSLGNSSTDNYNNGIIVNNNITLNSGNIANRRIKNIYNNL